MAAEMLDILWPVLRGAIVIGLMLLAMCEPKHGTTKMKKEEPVNAEYERIR